MTVLVLANNDVGLYQFRKELIEELLNDNRVIISAPYGQQIEPLKELGCIFIDTPVDRRGINPVKDIRLFNKYLAILKKEKPDLVVTYTIKPNVYGGMACRFFKVPYAVNITGLGSAFENGGPIKTIVTLLNKISCKGAKIVFFENEENRQYFINSGIVDASITHRLNGAGVNLDKYKVAEYPADDKIKFLFMGRVMAEKGIDELFAAMKRLIADGINCELDVLGEYEEDYKAKIEQCEKEGWLRYHGFQKDVRPFIEKCHCFVLPSWHEGMANTNLESAASGRPVITSNIPGCMEAVIDGKTGLLAERKNVESLYNAMFKFANLSYEERKAMGFAGRVHMEEAFDKKSIVADTVALLRKIK